MGLHRVNQVFTVTVLNGAAISEAIPVDDMIGGLIKAPTAWSAANIGFKFCDTSDGTFVPMKDEAGAVLQITSVITNAAYSYFIPTKVLAAGGFIKLWSKNTGSEADVNQAADRSVVVCLSE